MPELTSTCPICGAVASSAADEVAHMNAAHPDVIAARLEAAGFRFEGGRWVDLKTGADWPLPGPVSVSALAVNDPLGFAPTLVAVRRLLCFFPGRAWRLGYSPGSGWLLIDFEPAWGQEATPENAARSFSLWLNTGAVYRVDSCGAAEDDPIPLETLNPETDKL